MRADVAQSGGTALRFPVYCLMTMMLAACGGGSSGNSTGATTYSLSATAGSGGSISPSAATVNAGGTATFTVTPSTGYTISGVAGCGGALSGNTYTTGTINASCTVTAAFIPAQYVVRAAAGIGGAVSPSSAIVIARNGAARYSGLFT